MATKIKVFVQPTSKRKSKKNSLVDTEAALSSGASSAEDSTDDDRDNEYDYDDGFIVRDSEDKGCTAPQKDDLYFERRRADKALDEVHAVRKRLATAEENLRSMIKKKIKWQRRAKIAKAMVEKLQKTM